MANLINLANKQQVYLERLKAGLEKDYDKVHEELLNRIRQVLTALDVDNLQDLTKKKLEKVLLDLKTVHNEIVKPQMQKLLDGGLQELSKFSTQLEIVGLTSTIANPPTLKALKAAEVFKVALDKPIQATGELLKPFMLD
ncbi:MAG: hypothetical protein ACRC1D_08130, partial [Culicoidibacterales bacterium]